MMVIWLNNVNYNDAVKNPFMKALARRGTLLKNYRAIGHPAQSNYIAAITGSTYDINDNNVHNLNVTNIVDQLDSVGLSWKVYAKNFPGPCYNGEFNQKTYVESEYFRFTNPFMSMNNIRRNPFRCQKIVDAAEFKEDYNKNTTPAFSWYIPNGYESGLVTNLQTSSRWLASFLHNKLSNVAYMTDNLILVAFDQSNPRVPEKDAAENNHVWAVAFGNVANNVDTSIEYNHYSILSTIQSNWGLPTLGKNDLFAPPLSPLNAASVIVSTTA
jgi:acid phosphatase